MHVGFSRIIWWCNCCYSGNGKLVLFAGYVLLLLFWVLVSFFFSEISILGVDCLGYCFSGSVFLVIFRDESPFGIWVGFDHQFYLGWKVEFVSRGWLGGSYWNIVNYLSFWSLLWVLCDWASLCSFFLLLRDGFSFGLPSSLLFQPIWVGKNLMPWDIQCYWVINYCFVACISCGHCHVLSIYCCWNEVQCDSWVSLGYFLLFFYLNFLWLEFNIFFCVIGSLHLWLDCIIKELCAATLTEFQVSTQISICKYLITICGYCNLLRMWFNCLFDWS